MQAEFRKNNRGNGFIISPAEGSASKNKKPSAEDAISGKLTVVKNKVKNAGASCASYAKNASRSLTVKVISCAVFIGCIFLFFHFFTFATGVYAGNEKIAVVSGKECFSTALSEAKNVATSYGVKLYDTQFSTSTVISLRKDVLSSSDLKNEMLIAGGSFVNGCTVYSDNTEIFSTESKSVAEKVVAEYISQYSIDANADVTHSLTFKPTVIKKSKVSTPEECLSMLNSNTAVSVISIVNNTSSKVIPFETKTEKDDSLYIGETVTVTKGHNGSVEICEESVYENGTLRTNRIASEKVVVEPVKQVVKVGTKYKKVLDSGLSYPLNGTLSSPFGSRWGRMHEGIDIAVSEGTSVKAAECGTVSYVSENAGGYGKFIQIDHGHGVVTAYAHLSKINVKVGDTVSSDTVIALSGNTGRSTGPHLHFEIVDNGTPVDPLKYLKQMN